MSTFVLLHGAFRGAWAWSEVIPHLEGHDVYAPDLLSAGARYQPGAQPFGLSATIADVVTLFERHRLRDVILAGHSQGGFVARAASQHLADRIAMLAYLDAPVPRHGERAQDLIPPALVGVVLPVVEPASWVAPIGGDPRLTPVPAAIALEPVTLTDPQALSIPERFAFCAHTPPTYPCWNTRARLDATGSAYEVLDADHDAPSSAPDLVARWLLAIASEART